MVIHHNPVITSQTGVAADTPRESTIGLTTNITMSHGRKSLVIESDSARKKHCNTGRMNTAAAELSSSSGVIPMNIFHT